VRLAGCQGLAVVLAIDDAHVLDDRRDLERLTTLDGARVTVLRVGRPTDPDDAVRWELALRLPPLSRGEAEQYLRAKLEAAGRSGTTFTSRAVARLHALSGGVPRGLERLAGLALAAGAVRGLEIIPPEVVDDVAPECAAIAPG
jgi:type II secretory pathway predicted ATPase ExeA